MQSIHKNKTYLDKYKEQFRNMTDEQIEQHIGLEKVRYVIEGLEIRKIVKEIKQEKEKQDEAEKKQCTKCKVFR